LKFWDASPDELSAKDIEGIGNASEDRDQGRALNSPG
jgi:hypothetical protein